MSQQFHSPGHHSRQYPLDYWLSRDVARATPEGTQSVLRNMAWNQGQWRGLAVACGGSGAALLAAALLILILGGPAVGIVLFAVAGLGLLGGAVLALQKLRGVPRIKAVMQSRAPGKFSSGLGLAAFLAVVFGIGLFPVVAPLLQGGPLQVLAFVAAYALMLVVVVSLFAVPAFFSEHAREHFRRRIDADPQLRRYLEEMALTWQDNQGGRSFGPL